MNPPQSTGHSSRNMLQREETPISKYLANLEKRKSIFHPRISPTAKSGIEAVTMKLNFNDDTFYGGNPDQSLLQSGSPEPLGLLAASSAFKRRRTSIFTHDNEDEDPETYRARISDLEKMLRQTQAELIDCRTTCTKLEQASNNTKKSYIEKMISFEQSEAESKTRLKEATGKVSVLETKLEQSLNRESELSANLRQQREAHNVKFVSVEEQLTELKKENCNLKQKLGEEAIERERAVQKLQAEYNETERGAEKWIVDSQIYQDQLKLTQAQLERCQAELKKAQLDAIKFQETAIRSQTANVYSSSEIEALDERVKKFENLFVKEQASSYSLKKQLEKTNAENEMLRSTMQSEMMLHEQLTSLENQVTFLRQEVAEKGKAEAERDAVKKELLALKEIISKLDYNCNTPLAFESSLRLTQNLLLELKHENTTLKLELDSSLKNSAQLQTEIVSLRDQLGRLKNDNNKLSTDTKKLSKRMFLLAKDRDGLKDLKESYEQEFDGQISEPLKARIVNLEEVISGYEALLNEDKKNCTNCTAKTSLIENLRTELENMRRQNETLSVQDQTTVMEGETTGIKIVSLANNPSMMSIEIRLQECLKENEELKEKLRGYEQDTQAVPGGAAILMEKKKLEEDLHTLERKHEILTEAYDYETVHLQQACTKLFGFYVTLVREPQSQIRLQSVNSTCPDDLFIFQEGEQGDMMLLDTPVLEHFRDDIDRLMREGSIPCFLASVTITYVEDGERFSQPSTSQSQSQPPQGGSVVAQRSQAPQVVPPTRCGIEMVDRSESENESEDEGNDDAGADEDSEDDFDEEEPEPDDDRDEEDEDDEESEQEDVIMIDSD